MPSNRSSGQTPPTTKKVDYKGEAAKRLVQDCIEAVRRDQARLERDKQDWLNLLFYRGGVANQWVAFDGGVWREIPADGSEYGLPPEVPRQATNVFKRKIDGIAAILNQSDPAQEWRPAKNDDEARATAEVVQDALPVLREEAGYPRLRNLINLHVAITDKVAFEVYYDNDEKYGTEQIDHHACRACGWSGSPMEIADADDACPQCQAPADTLELLLDPKGAPVGQTYPKGRICSRLYPSFEISLPPNARECDERKVPYLVCHTALGREEAARLWPDKAEAIRQARGESTQAGQSTQYASALRNLSSPTAAAAGIPSAALDTVLVWRVVHDPIEDKEKGISFPEGLDVVLIDGEIIDGGPLPLVDDDGQPMKPFVLRTYQLAPGTPYGLPPADDLVVLQKQRNLIETLLILILLHEAAPRTFIPTTITLEDEITGVPGQQIRYRGSMPGEKPYTEPGKNPPEGLYRALEMNDQAFDAMSGLNAVLEGQRPEGGPTLGEVQILRERGMATFKSPLDLLVDFEKRVSYLLLQTARQSAWSKRLIRRVTDGGEWEVREFDQADLHGTVDVYVNPASAWPKSQLLTELRIKDAVAMGVLNPQDPEIGEQILSMWDLTELKASLDVDKKQVARELDRWRAATGPADIVPPGAFINLGYHVFMKSQFMKTEEAEAIQQGNPPVWQAMNAHIQQLKQRQMMEQAPAPGGPPPGGQGGKPPGGPDGSALEGLIQQGVLKPAPGKPQSPLDQMVQSGHLKPAPGAPESPLDALVASGQLQPAGAVNGNGQPPPQGPTGPSIDQMQGEA